MKRSRNLKVRMVAFILILAMCLQSVWTTHGSQAVEKKETKSAASDENPYGDNPLAQAKESLTGEKSDREVMTSSGQTMTYYLSRTGDYLTSMLECKQKETRNHQ